MLCSFIEKMNLKNDGFSPANVALLVGHCPEYQRVAGSIPGQGTCMPRLLAQSLVVGVQEEVD